MSNTEYRNVDPATRIRMQTVRREGTEPELAVRRILHGMGYRYRLHKKDLPGTPDIVLVGRRKIIFIHGCFWHGHKNCRRAKLPTNNIETWRRKIEVNKMRDSRNTAELSSLGWHILVLWECEVADLSLVRERLTQFLSG